LRAIATSTKDSQTKIQQSAGEGVEFCKAKQRQVAPSDGGNRRRAKFAAKGAPTVGSGQRPADFHEL
jgi:hypothetical protein